MLLSSSVAQNLYKPGQYIQNCCLVPDSSRQHCDTTGITVSYILFTGILCPRPTDGDSRLILRLGSRLRTPITSNDSSLKDIRTYRTRNLLIIQYSSKKNPVLCRFSAAVHNPHYYNRVMSETLPQRRSHSKGR